MRDAVPFDLGPIHFVGIGGIGMSGIAEVMLNLGYSVQGSDQKKNPNTERLAARGARIHIGHDGAQVSGAGAVVVSSAVPGNNPEVIEARRSGIPIVRRAEMLAELMRLKYSVAVAGTHGKTTTTSLVALMLDAAGLDPTVINGGIIQSYGSNAKMGTGDWMVIEADESDGSFLKLRGTIGIVTNIDPEHMEHYGSFDVLRGAFRDFIEAIPFYGFGVLCIDHPEVQALNARIVDRRIITYGFNPHAQVRAEAVSTSPEGSRFTVTIRDRTGEETARIEDVLLPMPGRHNVQNTLAAIAVGFELGATPEAIRKALAGFAGVKRRFTTTGHWNGVRFVDDYGHHPVEIAAVLKAAREVTQNRVIAVAQPHRYSRLHDLFDDFCTCFNEADQVLIGEVYAAGEAPIDGADRDHLIAGIRAHGHRAVEPTSEDAVHTQLRAMVQPGDVVVFLGAGDITRWAHDAPARVGAFP
jgi:UDP-N-acetylmuramate--alanine ligase